MSGVSSGGGMALTWSLQPFDALDGHQVYQLLALRTEVFVVEQQCPYQDADGVDLRSGVIHLLGHRNGRLLACARLLPPTVDCLEARIGRICTAASERGNGLGHELLRRAIEAARDQWPGVPQYVSAQAHLQDYYARHGFVAVTAPYLEDDIPHLGMRRSEMGGEI